MRYVKPTVADLYGRVASGDSVNACVSGTSVQGGADNSCHAGTSGISNYPDCVAGGAATGFSCLPGGEVSWECATGGIPGWTGGGGLCATGSAA